MKNKRKRSNKKRKIKNNKKNYKKNKNKLQLLQKIIFYKNNLKRNIANSMIMGYQLMIIKKKN